MTIQKCQIHIPSDINPYPAEHEISAAVIVAKYFRSDITFIKRSPNRKTADFKIKNQIWELKSPTGNGRRTIQNNLRKADGQSSNIILDLRQCKMHPMRATSRIKYELSKANDIKHLIVIQKNNSILALK